MNLIAALGQAVDFLYKACVAYAATPEGEKELNDVIVALEGTAKTPEEPGNSSESEAPASRYRR